MKKLLFLSLITAIMTVNSFAQGYEINVNIKGVADTVVYLGHHFGDKKYVIDTTAIDAKGNAIFKGDKKLNKGIYIVVMPSLNMQYFELLISDNQSFSLATDTANFVESMIVKKCNENTLFNQYQVKMAEISKKMQALNKEYEAAKDNKEEQDKIREQITEINKQRIDYMNNVIDKNPDLFFTKILLAMKEVDIPDAPLDENGEPIDPAFKYKYYKAHYFDYTDFSENGLLRTPIFENKIDYYFDKMVVPLPDSLIPEAYNIINKTYTSGDSLMFQYMTSHLLHYFESSKVMGFDAVFVAIAEEWYLSGKATWAQSDTAFIRKLGERVSKITPTKLGNIAHNLQNMQSIDGKKYSLHDIEAKYTVLVFFEPNCGHCTKEVPKLVSLYQDSLKNMGVKIVAFYTQYDHAEWKEFADEKNIYADGWYNIWDGPYPHSKFRDFYDIYSTPVIYVLDENKKIVGKRLNVDNIKGLIDFMEKKKQKENEEN